MHPILKQTRNGHPSRAPRPPKQERSLRTCQRLIDAARKIFVRDGFERARLEDIAAAIGKTRGAFYAHFKDKEDVFLAIFEQDLTRDRKHFASTLSRASSKEEALDALSSYLVEVTKDKQRMLLGLEFKMYAIRHPHKRKRLAALYSAVCWHGAKIGFGLLLPEWNSADECVQRVRTAQFGAIVDGLGLNRIFDCGSLADQTLLHIVQACAHVLLE
jgi:AcrR family transcriptional regulator